MTVLDASAVLAMLLHESGRDKVLSVLNHASISTVNLSEVYAKSAEKGLDAAEVATAFAALPVRIVPFTSGHALTAGQLRQTTRHKGLSFADRACLALGLAEQADVMTADRQWLDLNIGVNIICIR